MLKRSLLGASLIALSMTAVAEAPGGPSCGWGNMLFSGNSGMVHHFLASTTNGSTGNATFGMTSGTNGCSVNGRLTYSGKSMLNISAVMNEFSEDVARGDGEALKAVAVSMGIPAADRAAFAQVMHEHFTALFPSADVTADQVYDSMNEIMKSDERFKKFAS